MNFVCRVFSKLEVMEPAVMFDNVRLEYGLRRNKVTALRSLSLAIEKGSIYGLLGPSGCGKTSALGCCLGIYKPSGGSVHVFGQKPHKKGLGVPGPLVGYMPQNHALHGFFTCFEALHYYGTIYGLPKDVLLERTRGLLRLLDLDDQRLRSVQLSRLSGGQRRRISLACAMVHDPKLLILDEPTVGVDPALRQRLWDTFVSKASKNGTTVVITTHYMEEASKADRIGFMRRGTMLAEGTPSMLKRRGIDDLASNARTLDQVFLELCQRDEGEGGERVGTGLVAASFGRKDVNQELSNGRWSEEKATFLEGTQSDPLGNNPDEGERNTIRPLNALRALIHKVH